jgi:hypothetical protein
MNEDSEVNRDENLHKLLRTWKVEAKLPPRFQEAVWDRISATERKAESRFSWQRVTTWIEGVFSSPALAASYVALLLFAGVGTGYWRAAGRVTQTNSELRVHYIQSVDPYQMPR